MARALELLRRWGPRVAVVVLLALAIAAAASVVLRYEPGRDAVPLWVWPGLPVLAALVGIIAIRRAQGRTRDEGGPPEHSS